MTSFSCGQSWLSQNDVNSLLKGDWELDCPRMYLRRKSKKENDGYKGSGYIRFGSDKTLSFKMYSKQQSNLKDIFADFGSQVPGKLISHEDYYILTAYDYTGRKWISRCLFPEKQASFNNKSTILHSNLDLIECVPKVPTHLKENSRWIRFRIFENTKIPCNAATETEIKRKGIISGSSFSRDFAEFSLNDYKFQLESKNNLLEFFISRESQRMPSNIESRSFEALWFVFVRPFSWTTKEVCRGKTKTIVIRGRYEKPLKCGITPPINLSLEYAQPVWNLYCCYLRFILSYRDPSKLHPISALVRSAIRSSTGAIETQILSLAIVIEGMLKKFYPETGALTEEEEKSLDAAKSIIEGSTIDSAFKKRILSAIGGWTQPSASTKIHKLIKSGVVKDYEFTSWKKVRNPLAHGELPKLFDLQEYVDIHSKLLTMFYKLIFNSIAYNGPYVDYGAEGWPTSEFSAKK